MTTYAQAGVDVDLGNEASKILYEAAKRTWANRKGRIGEVLVPYDDFSGLRYINAAGLPQGTVLNIGFDGVGNAIQLAERMGRHDHVAHLLFRMVCDDALVRGAEPVLVGTVLDVHSLGTKEKNHLPIIRQLADGYAAAADAAGVAILNGELAELGRRVGGHGSANLLEQLTLQHVAANLSGNNWRSMRGLCTYVTSSDQGEKDKALRAMRAPERDLAEQLERTRTLSYNWGAGCVWFARKDRLFTGKEIQAGDMLVGFGEDGLRSNGWSLPLKIWAQTHGPYWHDAKWNGTTLGEAALALAPTYTKAVLEMTGGYDRDPRAVVHGVAHITGGGLPEKLGRALKASRKGALIDAPFDPPELMRYTQRLGRVTDKEAYKTLNMGQGMVAFTPDAWRVIRIAEEYGIRARVIGTVTEEPGVRIISKGAFSKGKLLEFRS